MNNEQFRKLVAGSATPDSGSKNGPGPRAANTSDGGALGSRHRAFVPMTPRSVGNVQADFARQVAERNQALRPQKTHKTSAPKGSKLAPGYVDRAQRRQDDGTDEREEKLKALELALRSGEIDRKTYDERRFVIAGGSLDSTHLVKGLDFKLLERIRKGEDVYGNKPKCEQPGGGEAAEEDLDDEFAQLEQREVQAIEKEQGKKKKGQFSTVDLDPGKKRTRNQILAELKASREAAKAQQQSSLGSKFKRIGMTRQKPGTTRMERDAKGREVLIIVDEDGNEKRKVRKLRAGEEEQAAVKSPERDMMMPDPKAEPLGMEVPEQYRNKEAAGEDKDVDIFDGVGDDYDPLAGMDGSDSDSSDSDGNEKREAAAAPSKPDDAAAMAGPDKADAPAAATRNYFQDSRASAASAKEPQARVGLGHEKLWGGEGVSGSEADMRAVLDYAAKLRRADEGAKGGREGGEARAREERHRRLLESGARDDEDMDLGFGTSRLEDDEEMGDERVKLSVWGDEGGAGEGRGRGRGGGQKRKRGPKKRKGDGNSAADVLRVIEQRKKA